MNGIYGEDGCLEKAAIREVRLHDLRHSFVSLLIKQGAHPQYNQEQASHSSIQVTMEIYGHLFPSQNANGSTSWTMRLSYPQVLEEGIVTEYGSNKPLDSEEDLGGGGDPDRTGDPRLMSILGHLPNVRSN